MTLTITTPDLAELQVAVEALSDLPRTLPARQRMLCELAEQALAAIPESGEWRAAAACASAGEDARLFNYTPDLLEKDVKGGKATGDEISRAVTDYCDRCPVVASCYVWVDQEPEYRGIAAGLVWADKRVEGHSPRRVSFRPAPVLKAVVQQDCEQGEAAA